MSKRTCHTAAFGPAAVLAAFVVLCAQASATTVAPLPPSAYTTRAVCPPPAPGHAACQALQLLALTAAARAHTRPLGIARAVADPTPSLTGGNFGLTPRDLHAAYGLPNETASSYPKQTIALVDAYNDLNAEEDLNAYSKEFGLPECTTANKCFAKVNQGGNSANLPFPQNQASLEKEEAFCKGSEPGETTQKKEAREAACYLEREANGWTVEISLDIETAHAVCQNCHIALVEADSASYEDLEAAEEAAVALPATEISNSWAGPECFESGGKRECVADSSAFNHPGIVIAAAAGDDGYLNWLEEPPTRYANFPASSPHVLAVGGTRLHTLGAGGEWSGETVWNDGGESEGEKEGFGAGGSGCSVTFAAPPWQASVSDWSSVGCGATRAVADVAADADPYSGVAVHDTNPECAYHYEEAKVKHVLYWCTIGGTSLASPLIASVFALAGGAHGVEYPAQTLYENVVAAPASLHDVTAGSNAECLSPFNEATGLQGCGEAEEANTSCSSQLICLAAKGYDGPSGVGTPDGISAFQPPAEAGGGKPAGFEENGNGGSGAGTGGGSSTGQGASGPPAAGGSGTTPASTGTSTSTGMPTIQLSGLALTLKALIALNRSRPRVSQIAFTFTLNAAAHVRASLQRRVVRHGHGHWQTQTRPRTITALAGSNSRHLGGHGVLSAGSYRLTLTPAHGAARTIVFEIG
jgi:Subtilase family